MPAPMHIFKRKRFEYQMKSKLPILHNVRAKLIRMHLMEIAGWMKAYCWNAGPANMNIVGTDVQMECRASNVHGGRIIYRMRDKHGVWKVKKYSNVLVECVIHDNTEHLARATQNEMRKEMIAHGIAYAQNKLKIPIDKL